MDTAIELMACGSNWPLVKRTCVCYDVAIQLVGRGKREGCNGRRPARVLVSIA